ncbi:precorrin-2 dehydrogenase/sirohydrochlorin ferrochelatase family protein [Paenibacillus xerothermodurans]|uniref:precorrin-2 dehydrogenase n=1 Tax=Paenibacillus xerothermodurans TaxID=1977292 RepID=A0A2W1NQF4_PAEXE|nr:bifunctional precorrin-2 dehydrogenase/sirohydrochlorin ferrochelatase [Paenibacillus xerothermodurans]PZE19956.1 bifunctional precorrin-2 dehydrogenase/sirohydrochlorin ferrochelatase [Paenibacillus xerothermodurans]
MIERTHKNYYPLMLDLAGQPCVIIGGGLVAERKAEALIDAGAAVTVISRAWTPRLEQWSRDGLVSLVRQSYEPGMTQLENALLVFAATDQAPVNSAVRLEAQGMGKLVSVADDPLHSGFIVPAVVRRGKLVIAVSTGGASPLVAKRVREELERTFGAEYEEYLDLLQELRVQIQSSVREAAYRQQMFKAMLEWQLLDWIRSGRLDSFIKGQMIERIKVDPTVSGIERLGVWLREMADENGET